MVADSRAAAGADRLRPLNEPRPVAVETDAAGAPRTIVERGHRLAVARVQEEWLVEDEWWREPLGRRYYTVLTTSGSVRTVYTDIFTGAWFDQSY